MNKIYNIPDTKHQFLYDYKYIHRLFVIIISIRVFQYGGTGLIHTFKFISIVLKKINTRLSWMT
jgi:hypothetical protein